MDRKLRHLGRVLHHDPMWVDADTTPVSSFQYLKSDDFDANCEVGREISPERITGKLRPQDSENSDTDSTDESEEIDETQAYPIGKSARNYHRRMEQVLDSTFVPQKESMKKKRKHEDNDNEVVVKYTEELRDTDAYTASESSDSASETEKTEANDSGFNLIHAPRSSAVPLKSVTEATLQELVRRDRKDQSTQAKKKKNASSGAVAFEEIPMALTDPETRARTLAIATKMLDKKARREILEGAIHKYTHGPEEGLPEWFVKDERRHCFRTLPVTKEEIELQRSRFREINLRPCKKVAEAVGRKRRKATRVLHKLQKKGRTDPKARQKAEKLSVRRLMRSQTLRSQKKKPLDDKLKGEKMRKHQAAKRRRR